MDPCDQINCICIYPRRIFSWNRQRRIKCSASPGAAASMVFGSGCGSSQYFMHFYIFMQFCIFMHFCITLGIHGPCPAASSQQRISLSCPVESTGGGNSQEEIRLYGAISVYSIYPCISECCGTVEFGISGFSPVYRHGLVRARLRFLDFPLYFCEVLYGGISTYWICTCISTPGCTVEFPLIGIAPVFLRFVIRWHFHLLDLHLYFSTRLYGAISTYWIYTRISTPNRLFCLTECQ